MRPRPDAAENVLAAGGGGLVQQASMRPRPDAAENMGSRADDLGVMLLQ